MLDGRSLVAFAVGSGLNNLGAGERLKAALPMPSFNPEPTATAWALNQGRSLVAWVACFRGP
jgi:hypothetical protein